MEKKTIFRLLAIILVVNAASVAGYFAMSKSSPQSLPVAARDNRLAAELGNKAMGLSRSEKEVGINYVRLMTKLLRASPPIIHKDMGYTRTATDVEGMARMIISKELSPILGPLRPDGDAGRLRLAANRVSEAVLYCYNEDVRQGRRLPNDDKNLTLLRLTAPPITTTEAAEAMLRVCVDLAELCDPAVAQKLEKEKPFK